MDRSLGVRLQHFEGPLDLLLHLIEKNKIDIYDIPIAEITEQYMDYVRQLQEEDPETASRFLVMAATLLEIKSRMLLPGTVLDDEEDEDPRQALIDQLTTYRIYKEAARRLNDRQLAGASCYCRGSVLPDEVRDFGDQVDADQILDDLTLRRLSSLFEELLRRREDAVDPVRSRFGRIRQEKMTLAQRMDEVRSYFSKKRKSSFIELMEETGGGRMGAIMTFLSVLELAKSGFLFLQAGKDSDDIQVSRREESAG